MRASILKKAREGAALSERFFEENAALLETCARAVAERLREGGKLWTLGNGGSACDAEHVSVEFSHPIIEKRRALPAFCLVQPALLTAVGNDTDFARIFEEQIAICVGPRDVVLGISTSGASANVARAMKRARAQSALTVGFTGRDGGTLVDLCDHCFTVKSWSTHRIQEVHTVLLHILWDQVHVALGEDDVL